LAFSSLLVCATLACAEEKPKAIIARAIEAQGGKAKVAKLRTMRIKAEGTLVPAPDQPAIEFTVEDTWRMPNQYKSTSTFAVKGKKITQVQTIDGESGWSQIGGEAHDLPKEDLAEMKEQKYAEDLDRLGFLEDKAVEMSVLDEIKVDGKPAVGVLLKSKGHRDVKLFFDKASGLLVKREQRILDPDSKKEIAQEVVFGDYEEKDGLKHYKKITAYRDGKKFIEAKVTEIEFFDKLDDKVFAKP
jgi:hypothetical protein